MNEAQRQRNEIEREREKKRKILTNDRIKHFKWQS